MPENIGMRRICTKLGFTFHRLPDSQNIVAEIDVSNGIPTASDETKSVEEGEKVTK
jgi:hypothetical protein